MPATSEDLFCTPPLAGFETIRRLALHRNMATSYSLSPFVELFSSVREISFVTVKVETVDKDLDNGFMLEDHDETAPLDCAEADLNLISNFCDENGEFCSSCL